MLEATDAVELTLFFYISMLNQLKSSEALAHLQLPALSRLRHSPLHPIGNQHHVVDLVTL